KGVLRLTTNKGFDLFARNLMLSYGGKLETLLHPKYKICLLDDKTLKTGPEPHLESRRLENGGAIDRGCRMAGAKSLTAWTRDTVHVWTASRRSFPLQFSAGAAACRRLC
ncbi:hypothetical protein IRJ41_020629, partial [Triplophysa rosa]